MPHSADPAADLDVDDPQIIAAARPLLERHQRGEHEDNIRAAIRDFLISTKLARPEEIRLEDAPAEGSRRFVDLTSDAVLIEVKRRISGAKAGLKPLDEHVQQLDDYLAAAEADGKPQRMGILTDGKYWVLRWPHAGEVRTHAPYAYTLSDAEHWLGLFEWLRDESHAVERRGIAPSDDHVRAHFGPDSPRYERDIDALRRLYNAHRDNPTIAVKRNLWRNLLAAALGEAVEEAPDLHDLFLRHTYLSAVVGLAVQAAFGIDVRAQAARQVDELLSGRAFADRTGLRGVVESDFFSWPAEVGGDAWITALARRISAFEWRSAEHDIARTLYEAVIPASDRKQLGEYYTPDWLAREIVDAAVTDPLNQRVLDPACGSGAFIFAAVRKYLSAARADGLKPGKTVDGLLNHVIGIDVHPVAVHLARATWTFAARDALELARDAGEAVSVSVPIYLGDSLQLRSDTTDLFATQTVTIPIDDDPDAELERGDVLEFPRALVEMGDWFDTTMANLADAIEGGDDPALALHDADIPEGPGREMLLRTAATLERLHAEGRDHIWAYYTRNLVRPLALQRDRVDVIVGNPPWLTYSDAQAVIRQELESQSKRLYQIWTGGKFAPHQNVAAFFFTRCVDLYLNPGGLAAMVLPHSALSDGQFREWRKGKWGELRADMTVQHPWDLEKIEPNTFFPVPSCVVFARARGGGGGGLQGRCRPSHRVGSASRPAPFRAKSSRYHTSPARSHRLTRNARARALRSYLEPCSSSCEMSHRRECGPPM